MERKIGEVFTYEGKAYQVVEGAKCDECTFIRNAACYKINEFLGPCCYTKRKDHKSVIFKKIKNMENNQLTIDIPEGMEIDLENSNLAKGIVKFKKHDITYKNIEDAIRPITYTGISVYTNYMNRLKAISQLINIARYYNKDWKPDWSNTNSNKYIIIYNNNSNAYEVDYNCTYIYNIIYFKTRKDALAVIDNPNFRDILDAIYKN